MKVNRHIFLRGWFFLRAPHKKQRADIEPRCSFILGRNSYECFVFYPLSTSSRLTLKKKEKETEKHQEGFSEQNKNQWGIFPIANKQNKSPKRFDFIRSQMSADVAQGWGVARVRAIEGRLSFYREAEDTHPRTLDDTLLRPPGRLRR